MPKYLMSSFYDENGHFIKHVGDNITVVINNITDRGILLSDINTYEKDQEKLRKKETKAHMQMLINNFISKYDIGTDFEAEVIRVQNTKAYISLEGVQGIIKKEDTNWNEIDRLEDLLFEGETINAKYLKHQDGNLYFSLKLLKEKPYDDSLYNLSLDELLKYIGHNSNIFIGQAKQYHYGLFIENLYSADENQKGKLLVDPIYGYNLRAIVPNTNFNIEENKYYKTKIILSSKNRRQERNQLFQFLATEIEETSNPYQNDVKSAFQINTTNPAANQRDIKLLDEIGKNMYATKDRMFFELIQNADDAASIKGVLVHIKTNGDYLIIKHNGYSFDRDDFVSITTAANGTKKANENKTGYKGIGFKSVFTDSEQVFIYTGGYKFKFDKYEPVFQDFDKFYLDNNPTIINNEAKEKFMGLYSDYKTTFDGIHSIPWQLEPIWIDHFPEELGTNFTQSNVAIALKLGENKIIGNNGYCQAIEDIISNPKFMLFLRNTKRIDFNGKSVSKATKNGIITLKNSFSTKRIEYFKREDFDIEINNTVFEKNGIDIRIKVDEQDKITGKVIEAKFVDLHNQELENIPKKIAISNSTTISFAIPIRENGELELKSKCSEISMFAFLPTLVKDFIFPFYINANFILDPPRQRILGDNPWNFYLMQEIARHMVSWCGALNAKQDKNALNILVSQYYSEESTDTKQLARYFNAAYKSALESEAYILNHKEILSKQSEIIIDKSGLSTIICPELFCKIIGTKKFLPSNSIDSSILEEKIFEKIEKLTFDDLIKTISNNTEFNEWLNSASKTQKDAFFDWVKKNETPTREKTIISFVSNLPLFQFGEKYKSYNDTKISDCIITTKHIVPIRSILTKLGLECSNNIFDENHPFFDLIVPSNEENLFNLIKERNFSELTSTERKELFLALKNFNGVGDTRLKEIALFKNLNNNFKSLGEIVAYRENIPTWLFEYTLCKEDNYIELSDYLIKVENEFKEVIQVHYDKLNTSFSELFKIYKDDWTGQFTRNIIDHYIVDNDILAIIEESDTNTKKYFLESIKKLDLSSTSYYKKDSYEYRVLNIALSTLDVPSSFSSKIYFEGQCINNFSISDEIVCDFNQNGESKKIIMSLAQLLPQYKNQTDAIEKIKSLFENKKDLDKFFDVKSKSIYEVNKELNLYLNIPETYFSAWNVNGNAHQYLFATYYRRQKKGWNNLYIPKIELSRETDTFINELLDFLFNNNILIDSSPFTYHLGGYFKAKFFDCDYIFENEQLLPAIEKWADNNKKKQYLIQNGVRESTSFPIQFRRLFLEDKNIDFIDNLSPNELASGIKFIAIANGVDRPFIGNNQKNILIYLKEKPYCKLSNEWNIEKIKEKSKEWDSAEYNKWIKGHYPHIYIYSGKIPKKISYNGTLLLSYEDENYNYYYNKEERQLFISNVRKIEDILFEIAKEGHSDFDFDDYRMLCLEGKITISKEDIVQKDKAIESLSESNRRKDAIIEQYRAIYGDLKDFLPERNGLNDWDIINTSHLNDQDEKNHINVIERPDLSDEEQEELHKEAEQIVKKKLERDGYDCSKWIIDEYETEYKKWHSINQIDNIISPKGENINLIIKSAKGGYIYLSATDFEFLTSNSNNVLMVWDGNNVHSVTAEDIFNKNSNVNLIFDTEYTPKHYYAALSKVFQYVKRTTFAVKNPNYNPYDTIKSFGMDSKTEGIQELFDDNDL